MSKRKPDRCLLEFQSDRIEVTLARHGVSARVTGGFVAPRWVQFQLLPSLGARVSKIKGLADDLALALDADTCRISRKRGMVSVEIPRADPETIRLLPIQKRLIERREIPFGAALLGLADDGAPLLVRLPSPQVAHLLVAGTTGSGKSALAKTIIASLALNHRPSQIGFVLIDPKRRAFGPLAGLPHLLRAVLSETEIIEQTLQSLVQLMLDRDREGRVPASDKSSGEPRVIVVIDELADLLMVSEACQHSLTRLAQRGREAGIHLIAATQKPAAAVVGSLTKANFPVRLVGRVTSPEDAKVATGYAKTGAELLVGPGDFIAVSGGQATRFQAAYISTGEIVKMVGGMQAARRSTTILCQPLPAPVAVIELPNPQPQPEIQPASSDLLVQRVDLAREQWKIEHLGDGRYEWGGRGRIAAAIFQDGNASTAGHRHAAVQAVCAVLEAEDKAQPATDEPAGIYCDYPRQRAKTPTPTTHWKRVLFRPRRSTKTFPVMVVGFHDGALWQRGTNSDDFPVHLRDGARRQQDANQTARET